MTTARLNRLIKAYRIAKALFGDANRGRAIPGTVFRWCHRVRQAVWAEIELVVNHLNPTNKNTVENQPMATETGESLSAPGKRADDRAMKAVISALQDGAHLRIHTTIRRAAIEGLPAKDSRNGRTISANRCKRLAREGVITEVAMDRYAMNPDFELKTQTTYGAIQ
ncbi:hypothetical protein [Marinobacter shengliensis]|uniref:Uncharacterized protein n=1 Tax=Marinobacter shengliensis TaxID=1389223 RepID=A0ABV4W4M2_9GAMM